MTRFDSTTGGSAFMHDHGGKLPMEAPVANGGLNKFVQLGSSPLMHHENERALQDCSSI